MSLSCVSSFMVRWCSKIGVKATRVAQARKNRIGCARVTNVKRWGMRIVIDTCVLVAAARSRVGASFALISSLPDSRFQVALSVALYTEWQDVVCRPEHLPAGAKPSSAMAFLRYLASIAHLQDIHFLWRPFLRDPDDDMVLECAVAAGAQFIITHNIRDFQRSEQLHVRALTPRAFLNHLRDLS